MPSIPAPLKLLTKLDRARALAAVVEGARRSDLIGAFVFILVYVALEWITYSHEHLVIAGSRVHVKHESVPDATLEVPAFTP